MRFPLHFEDFQFGLIIFFGDVVITEMGVISLKISQLNLFYEVFTSKFVWKMEKSRKSQVAFTGFDKNGNHPLLTNYSQLVVFDKKNLISEKFPINNLICKIKRCLFKFWNGWPLLDFWVAFTAMTLSFILQQFIIRRYLCVEWYDKVIKVQTTKVPFSNIFDKAHFFFNVKPTQVS